MPVQQTPTWGSSPLLRNNLGLLGAQAQYKLFELINSIPPRPSLLKKGVFRLPEKVPKFVKCQGSKGSHY